MISRSDWRSITRILEERLGEAKVKELDPYGSSFYCSRCGWENKDLNGAVFECGGCGLRIDRQLNAAINLYMRLRFGYTTNWEDGRKRVELKMEGASQMVGHGGSTLPLGWVRRDRGKAEWDQ